MGENRTQSGIPEGCIPIAVFSVIEIATFITVIILLVIVRIWERQRVKTEIANRAISGRRVGGNIIL